MYPINYYAQNSLKTTVQISSSHTITIEIVTGR